MKAITTGKCIRDEPFHILGGAWIIWGKENSEWSCLKEIILDWSGQWEKYGPLLLGIIFWRAFSINQILSQGERNI